MFQFVVLERRGLCLLDQSGLGLASMFLETYFYRDAKEEGKLASMFLLVETSLSRSLKERLGHY